MLNAQRIDYTIRVAHYEGPLDLLLQLIEKAELDITSIALAQVADQYLHHVRQMQVPDAGEMSAFIVLASRLLVLKSRALLPQTPQPTDEADDSIDLVTQLKLYQYYKQGAAWVRQRDAMGWQSFARAATLPSTSVASMPLQMTLDELLAVWQQRLRLIDAPTAPIPMPAPKILTVGDVVTRIRTRLQQMRSFAFLDLLPQKSRTRVDVVVSLWAVLEMIKRRAVDAHQATLFGPITLEARPDAPTEMVIDDE
jgi:segregation and condensation protein A